MKKERSFFTSLFHNHGLYVIPQTAPLPCQLSDGVKPLGHANKVSDLGSECLWFLSHHGTQTLNVRYVEHFYISVCFNHLYLAIVQVCTDYIVYPYTSFTVSTQTLLQFLTAVMLGRGRWPECLEECCLHLRVYS